MFKGVSKDILTYLLNRRDLRDAWSKIIDKIPLEPRVTGRISDMKEMTILLARALIELIEQERVDLSEQCYES